MEEGVDPHIPPAAALLTDEIVTNVTTTIHQQVTSQSQVAPAESVDPEAQGIPFGPPSGLSSSLLAAVGQVSPEEPTNSEETQPSSLGACHTHLSNRNTNNRMVEDYRNIAY